MIEAEPARTRRCPACAATTLSEVMVIEDLPVHVGVLWDTPESARNCATGLLRLEFCDHCGLLTNTAFDAALLDYGLAYDNSLHASAVFRDFESALVSDLVSRHALEGSDIVEIGGGSGRFLELLCAAGSSRGTGYDPSLGTDSVSAGGTVRLLAEYFGTDTPLGEFDLLVCRQVLEHVADLPGFLAPIRTALQRRPAAVGYFDVPNSTMLLEDLSIWDLVYEHCHYFVDQSARVLFESSGFEVQRSWTGFGDQFLSIEVTAEPGGLRSAPTVALGHAGGSLRAAVEAFGGHAARRRAEWAQRLAGLAGDARRTVVWGAGARAVTFFSMLGIGEQVAYLVDANPAKQGTYLAGSGHPIHEPGALAGDGVDVVILLNAIYTEEIRDQLDILSPGTELVVV